MTEFTALHSAAATTTNARPGQSDALWEHSVAGGAPSRIGHLIAPTWADVESARDQYRRDAKRFRFWRWWLIGMFTFYTTLVGILLFTLTVSS